MNRVYLAGGRWFDESVAERWEEATWWDGRNNISKATGSQWEHECLYRSRKGLWILHSWSQWQGSKDSWIEIGADQAKGWLLEHEETSDLERLFPGTLEAAEA